MKHLTLRYYLATALTLMGPLQSLSAQTLAEPVPLPEPPELPLPVQSGDNMVVPDITIIRRAGKTIHEYRVNGELYKVKIVPDYGPPYYLVDIDGDGNMEMRHSDLEKGSRLPKWLLLSW
jgi:hypothetical protein